MTIKIALNICIYSIKKKKLFGHSPCYCRLFKKDNICDGLDANELQAQNMSKMNFFCD